ncbi:MAG TPA: PAS domain-containing sensor histidine kinase, partial [Candidatus Aminicenantes bacterium]|nr:PAS domain-containing sensor histidine kinase [Candidatus Aminicenantes bacterium]
MGNKKVKGVRLIVAAFIILFVLFVAARIFFEESKNISPGFVLSPTLLFTLWILISLFGITFLFILVRNMVKMYYDRHQQGRGHSFKNRLVFFFISFSIVPTLLLFFFATDIVSRSVDRWFRSPIESIMTQVKEVEQG